jgi:hypothetical protein
VRVAQHHLGHRAMWCHRRLIGKFIRPRNSLTARCITSSSSLQC